MKIKKNIVFISDTHGFHDHVRVPPCDILIHSGDFTNDIGKKSLRDFCVWFERQPAKHKILVAGNHDGALEKWPDLARALIKEYAPSAIYLEDSSCEIEGIKIWGSPWTPRFYDWAFNADRGEVIKKHWDLIPDDTDIVITHGPVYNILDIAGGPQREHTGCKDLYNAVQRIKPKFHTCGHIHHSYGTKQVTWDDGKKTTFINASICDEAYKPTRQPFQMEVEI